MMSVARRPPVRCQAVADAMITVARAGAGLASTDRSLLASLGCADIPMECLSLDPDYVVINKPVDVRMTGDFNVNVEKLIRHWCPTVKGKELKWVHQLDFATSGVLCVALHRDAAARACEAFRERRAQKTYLAVVEGDVNAEAVPRRQEELTGWGEGEDGSGAAISRKGRPNAVQHTPAHGFFQRKKDPLVRALERGETLSAEDTAFASVSWADIKHDKVASKPFVDAARADKSRIVAAAEAAAFNAAQGAPDRGVFRAPGDGPGTFRVDASVSEIPGDFRMRVDDRPGGKGKACRTIVEVLEKGFHRGVAVTKVLLRPHTGRRHQLRLHALHIGHPILGDATYSTAADIPRMCLHAHSLRLRLAPRDAPSFKGAPSEDDGNEAAAAATAEIASAGAAADEVAEAGAETARGVVAAAWVAGAATPTATAVERGRRTALKRKGRPAWRAGAGAGAAGGGEGTDGEGTIFEVVAPDPFVFVDGELQL